MRTTVNLPEDVVSAARSVAAVDGISLGEALAKLVRQGLRPSVRIQTDAPFPMFSVPGDAEPITLERTLQAEDEL
ncbi:MAG: antitoxin [Acidobacteria bacterium]|nr:antitoxin [Acidobacteriota bacterium]